VFVHCHPSGDPTPSPEDIRLTREAGEAGAVLGIDVLDHVIIAGDGFVSLREAGLYIPPAALSKANVSATSSSSLVRVPG
jgi:DNA repair protein RadC